LQRCHAVPCPGPGPQTYNPARLLLLPQKRPQRQLTSGWAAATNRCPPSLGASGLGRTLGDMDGEWDQGVPVEGRRLHQLQEGSVELTILTTLSGTSKRTWLQARDEQSRRAWRAFQSTQIAFTADPAVWRQEHPSAKATTRMRLFPHTRR